MVSFAPFGALTLMAAIRHGLRRGLYSFRRYAAGLFGRKTESRWTNAIFGIDGFFRPFRSSHACGVGTHGLRRGLHSFTAIRRASTIVNQSNFRSDLRLTIPP